MPRSTRAARLRSKNPTAGQRRSAGQLASAAVGKLYVVRHADAGHRGGPGHLDDARTLTERGRRQADGLRDQLADAGITRLVASPFVRCVDTVAPLAAKLALPVEEVEQLAEGRDADALPLLEQDFPGAIVLCTHGDVLPELLLAVTRGKGLPEGELRCAKGSTWIVERSDGGELRARYLPPPA